MCILLFPSWQNMIMEIEDMKKKYEQLQTNVSEHIQITQLSSLAVPKLVSDKSCSMSDIIISCLVGRLGWYLCPASFNKFDVRQPLNHAFQILVFTAKCCTVC